MGWHSLPKSTVIGIASTRGNVLGIFVRTKNVYMVPTIVGKNDTSLRDAGFREPVLGNDWLLCEMV